MIRREVLIISILSILVLVAGVSPKSSNGISTLSIEGDTNGKQGQDILVYLYVQNAQNIANMAIDITYDNSVLTANTVSDGSLASPNQNIDNNLGKISLSYKDEDITGSGSLAKISYHVKGDPDTKSDIKISINQITDTNGKSVPDPKIVNSIFKVDSVEASPTLPKPSPTSTPEVTTTKTKHTPEPTSPTTLPTSTEVITTETIPTSTEVTTTKAEHTPEPTPTTTSTPFTISPQIEPTVKVVPLTITPPPNINKEATGITTTVNIGTGTCTGDSCTISNDAPNGFPVGTTIVKWSAKDNSGETVSGTQSVTITDTTPPDLKIPSDIVADATGILTKINIGNAVATDLVDPNPVIINDASSGGFPVGTTTVTWQARDKFGNPSPRKLQIVTIKSTGPTITIPDVTVEATGVNTPVNLGTLTVKDVVDPNPTITNNAPSGGFPVGTTIVSWTVLDRYGNTASINQNIKVKDSTSPTITISDISTNATGLKTPVNLGTPVVKDLVDPNPTVTNSAPSGGFPVGTTTVKWTATDHSGNSGSVNQLITITNKEFPSIIAPPNIVVEATGNKTPVNLGIVQIKDSVDPNPIVTNNAPSGGFSLGTTTVVWNVKDVLGNTASANQSVTIKDTTSPNLTIADIVVEATGLNTTVNLGLPFVSDLADPSPTVTNNAPSGFPVGITTVKWFATDHSGNNKSVNQTVIVKDTTPPNLTIPSDLVEQATDIKTKIDIGNATAIDIVDPNPIITNDAPFDRMFSVGTANISWKAQDKYGNNISKVQHITLEGDSGLNITADSLYKQIHPSEIANYKINVTNTGLVGDSFVFVLNGTMEKENLNIDNINIANQNENSNVLAQNQNENLNYLNENINFENENSNIIYLNPENSNIIELNTSDSHVGIYNTSLTVTSLTNKSKSANLSIITEIVAQNIGSGGGGGSVSNPSAGGGGGGGAASSAEPFLNINKSETRFMDLVPNTVVEYIFQTPDMGIYQAGVTGTQSESDIPMKIELLNGPSNGTERIYNEKTYKYLNIYIGSKKINNVDLKFKVNNTWLKNMGLSKNNIKLVRYDPNKKWLALSTTVIKNDENYTYFDSKADHFSPYAIVGMISNDVDKQDNIINVPNDIPEIEYPAPTTVMNNVTIKRADNSRNFKIPSSNIFIGGVILLFFVLFISRTFRRNKNVRCKLCNQKISTEPVLGFEKDSNSFNTFCTEKCRSDYNEENKD